MRFFGIVMAIRPLSITPASIPPAEEIHPAGENDAVFLLQHCELISYIIE